MSLSCCQVVKLWDAGYVWELCKLLTQMLDDGGAKYLTFTDAKITNDTRWKLVGVRVSQCGCEGVPVRVSQ